MPPSSSLLVWNGTSAGQRCVFHELDTTPSLFGGIGYTHIGLQGTMPTLRG